MRFMEICKDGGPKSPVTSLTLIEIKGLFSIMFLKFNKGTREDFHNHAFSALTWFIKGNLVEERIVSGAKKYHTYRLSMKPKFTPTNNLHRVHAHQDSWCFSIRGPWKKNWNEYNEQTNTTETLANGRTIVNSYNGLPK